MPFLQTIDTSTRGWISAGLLALFMWIVGRLTQKLWLTYRAPKWLCVLCIVNHSKELNPTATAIQLLAYEFLPLLGLIRKTASTQWASPLLGFGLIGCFLANLWLARFLAGNPNK